MYYTTSCEIKKDEQNYNSVDEAVNAILEVMEAKNVHYDIIFFVRSGVGRRFTNHGEYRIHNGVVENVTR